MSFDEQSNWIEYAKMMPYSKRTLILNKYLLGYILIMLVVFLIVFFGLATSVVSSKTFEEIIDINFLIISLSSSLVFIAVNTFVGFKYGVEKGRIVYLMTFALIGAMNGLFKSLDENIVVKILEQPPIMFLGIAIILNLFSILCAFKIKDKE